MMEGETPLDYMIRVMRDEEADIARRDWAAQAAAPYLHARLASVEQRGTLAISHEERVTSLAERLAAVEAESSRLTLAVAGGLIAELDVHRSNRPR